MPTVDSSDTTTADGTEQTLAALTANKYYSAHVNLSEMAASDITILRLYIKVLTGSAYALYWKETYNDAQTDQEIIFIPPQPSVWAWKLTLEQTAGTNRDYEWQVYKV